MRNLTICPTINRPERILEMVRSFYETQYCSDLLILTKLGSITELLNNVNLSGYTHVTITNDDFVFRTKAWDSWLIDSMNKKPGFAYGFDGMNHNLPTTCMISTDIIKALGWIQLPGLEHLCGDMVWSYLGQNLNNIHYCKDVLIEHKHFMFGKAQMDSVYERTNSKDMYQKDNATFKNWLLNQAYDDVQKVKQALSL